MTDVARAAGVSQALVSYAYRNAAGVSPETRARILAVGRELGFRPDRNAAQLASKTSRTLGLFLLDIRNPFVADVYDGVNDVVRENDVHLLIAFGDPRAPNDRVQFDDLLGGGSDVVIAVGTLLGDAEVTDLLGPERLVSVGRRIPGVDSVATDEARAADLIVDHLRGLGHTRIACVAGLPVDDHDSRRREFERALREHGLAPRIETALYTQDAAAAATNRLLAEADPPTAIFANNDPAALGVMVALWEAGVRVPQDCSVVGFDNSPIARLPMVALTSVEQHARTLGRLAAERALARFASPGLPADAIDDTPVLVARGSTGPPPGSRIL